MIAMERTVFHCKEIGRLHHHLVMEEAELGTTTGEMVRLVSLSPHRGNMGLLCGVLEIEDTHARHRMIGHSYVY
jgi:hypothetical protein